MASRPLPRYFVTRSNDEWSDANMVSTLEPYHAIDSFFLGGRHVVEREWLVTIDAAGFLRALAGDELSDLPEIVQQDLAFNEVIGSAASRSIDGSEIYLFNLEALEQPPETPGLNDPVYLYGTLYGPFPAASDESLKGVQGQLTVNRIDLLAGIVNSSQYSFHYQTEAGGVTQRCFNFLLPGDREEEIMRGKGLVMAYPLMPGDIGLGDPWNEYLVSNLIFDMLSALKDDIEKEKVNHPLKDMVLPVVNRFSFEKDLEARGYVIKGEVAMRQPGAAGGLPNILPDVLSKPLPSAVTNAIGKIIKDKFTLPPEATVDEFISLARRALEKLPGYPPPRAKALQSRVRNASVEARGNASRKTAPPPRPINIPDNTINETQPSRKARRSEWMEDFISSHRAPASTNSETRLTNLSNAAESAHKASIQRPAGKSQPNWMNDFGQDKSNNKEEQQQKSQKAKPSEAKPDWMKDFD